MSGALYGGGGIAGQHVRQADVDEMVPSVVPAWTNCVHARLERRICVRPVSDEIRHRVYRARRLKTDKSTGLVGTGSDF